jgi:hypothetical protein
VLWKDIVTQGIRTYLPRDSKVAFSHESFYFYYQCRKMGYDLQKCPRGNEEYLVKLQSEPFTGTADKHFTMIGTADDYGFYKLDH